jgi:tRNA A37 N6-isopentenylltransferase MiaA
LAVALAQALGDAEVVNADASQVYADIPLLSARPDAAEMAGIPHRLFGHVDGGSAHNAARWAEEARRTLSHAHAAGKVPILVGGTGLYLRTLLDGIAPVPEIDPEIREAVRALPVARPSTTYQVAASRMLMPRSPQPIPPPPLGSIPPTRPASRARSRWRARPAGRSPRGNRTAAAA